MLKSIQNAADKRSRAAAFIILSGKRINIDFILGITRRLYSYGMPFALCGNGYYVKVNACREHTAMLMVGMVAAYLCPAGSGEKAQILTVAVKSAKLIHRRGKTRAGRRRFTVKFDKLTVKAAALYGGFQFSRIHLEYSFYFEIIASVSRAIASSSFVGITKISTPLSAVEILTSLPRHLFASLSILTPI